MTTVSRRLFLRQGSALGAAGIVVPNIVKASVLGLGGTVAPSERIVLGAIGIGGRGSYVLRNMLGEKDVQFVAIADIRDSRRKAIKQQADKQYGNSDCATYRDFRELLPRSDIDAVLIATGDRWHALASILAMKAGKDVYSEKPCGITIHDCQALEETVRRYGKVFQAGTQRRSIGNFQRAARMAQEGKFGKLHTLHASVYRPGASRDWLPAQPQPPQDEVDWDLWLGPAPWRPYNERYVKGGWRKHADFDAGYSLLDWGAHTLDLCQMGAGRDHTLPVTYTPGQKDITCTYADGVKVIMDFLPNPFGDRSPHYQHRLGTCPVRFIGSEGWIETGDSGDILIQPESLRGELLDFRRSQAGTHPGSHVRNFFDCVKSRSKPNAHAGVMRRSHVACHAAAIAWKLGRTLQFDPATETFVNDPEAQRFARRALRSPWQI